jgi:CHAD domain-containing protein
MMTPLQIADSSPLAGHLRELVAKRLHKLGQSLRFASSDDPVRAVHDLRVASRRLRAFGIVFADALGAKAHARLEKRLKRVAKAAGAVRDWDVQVELLDARARGAFTELERACLEHLLEGFELERERVARKAEKRLRKVDLDALSSAVASAAREATQYLASGAAERHYAAKVLNALVESAAERVPPADGAEHSEQLHWLRISVKELRYALELFEPLLGSRYALLYERATAAQELLGAHHDLSVLGELVARESGELEQRQRMALASGMKSVGEGLASERLLVAKRFASAGFEHEWWREHLRSALEERP